MSAVFDPDPCSVGTCYIVQNLWNALSITVSSNMVLGIYLNDIISVTDMFRKGYRTSQ